MFEESECKLKVIGDLSCLVGGPIEFLDKYSEIETPFRYFDPLDVTWYDSP